MTTHTHQTAPTQFVEANGVRFAYRRFGKTGGVPIVMNIHFRGTMDHWDPADNRRSGRAPRSDLVRQRGRRRELGRGAGHFPDMATDAIAFIKALGIGKADVLGIRSAARSPRRSPCKRPTWCASWSWSAPGRAAPTPPPANRRRYFRRPMIRPNISGSPRISHLLRPVARPDSRISNASTAAGIVAPRSARHPPRRSSSDRQIEREGRRRSGLSG